MAEVHLKGKSMEQRLRDRERNSGDTSTADHVFKPTQGARYHNIHTRGQGGGDRRVDVNDGGDSRVANNPGAKTQQSGGAG
jgi:hypothetical protein